MTYIPDFPYNKNQLILNSDRVIINSKSDSIFLFSDKAIGFSSNEGIHFNTNKNIILNGSKIQLGLEAKEPLIKGNQLENLFNKMFSDLENIGDQLYNAVDSNGNPIPSVATAGNILIKSVKRLKVLLKTIKSDQNYTI